MSKAIYKCPHCKKDIELELTKSGQLLLKASSPGEQKR